MIKNSRCLYSLDRASDDLHTLIDIVSTRDDVLTFKYYEPKCG